LSKLAKKGFTLTGRKTPVWKLILTYFISSSVLKEWWYCQNWNIVICKKIENKNPHIVKNIILYISQNFCPIRVS